ncbi:MAG: ABC transporter permease [Haloarculaceae archaeon]
MRSPKLAIARRDFTSLSREKTIVLALLVQLFVAAFSSFLVVGLTSMYDPGSVGGAGTVEAAVTGNATDDLVAAADDVDGIALREYESRGAAMDAFGGGRVDAVLVAEPAGERISVVATAPRGSLRTTLVVVQLRAALEAFERRERTQRAAHLEHRLVPLPPAASASPYFGFTYTVLLPLLLFLPVFISGSIAVDTVTEERDRGTLELLRVTPATLADIFDGKALTAVALAPAQALLWLGLLSLNGIAVANVPALAALVAALALLLVVFGLAVGLLAADRRRAQITYSLGIIVAFASSSLLPEAPATTVAKLAIDSATTASYLSVGGYLLVALVAAVVVRRLVARLDPERL